MKNQFVYRTSAVSLVLGALTAILSPAAFAQSTPVVSAQAAPATQPGTQQAPKKDVKPSPSNPMRVAFIDTSGEKGDDVYDVLNEAIGTDKNVERVSKEAITEAAKVHNLDKSDFRNGDKRQKRKADIDKFMNDLRAEVLIVVDVFGRGRKAQLVVIDNDGKELSDQRETIRKYKIRKKTAEAMIKKALQAATPSVVAFRQKGGWAPDAPPVAYDTVEQEEAYVTTATAAPQPEKKDKSETDDSAFKLKAGLFGTYGLTSAGLKNKSEKVDFPAKYPGFAGAINATYFFNDRVGLGFAAFGGYSPFTTILEGSSTKLSSYAAFAQAQLEIPIVVMKDFKIIPYVGGDFKKLNIKKGKEDLGYYGSQYLGVRAGLQFDYTISIVNLNLGGGVAPSLKTLISPDPNKKGKGLYGDPASKLVLAYDANLVLGFRVLSMLDVVAGYNFRYISIDKMKQKGAVFTAPPSYKEMDHLIFAGLRYVL